MTHATPSPTAPALAADDPRSTFARAVALAGRTVRAVRPDQLDLPTPCDGMDVRALLSHLVMVLDRVAAAGRGEPPEAWPVEGPDDAWGDAWDEAAHRLQDAWTDDAVLDRTVQLPWTAMPGREVLGTYTSEVTVHTWDLATATGQAPEFDDEVVGVALAAMRRELPTAERDEFWAAVGEQLGAPAGWEPPFASAVPVPDAAPPVEQLVAWCGRRP